LAHIHSPLVAFSDPSQTFLCSSARNCPWLNCAIGRGCGGLLGRPTKGPKSAHDHSATGQHSPHREQTQYVKSTCTVAWWRNHRRPSVGRRDVGWAQKQQQRAGDSSTYTTQMKPLRRGAARPADCSEMTPQRTTTVMWLAGHSTRRRGPGAPFLCKTEPRRKAEEGSHRLGTASAKRRLLCFSSSDKGTSEG
jgi:hypothetical protein